MSRPFPFMDLAINGEVIIINFFYYYYSFNEEEYLWTTNIEHIYIKIIIIKKEMKIVQNFFDIYKNGILRARSVALSIHGTLYCPGQAFRIMTWQHSHWECIPYPSTGGMHGNSEDRFPSGQEMVSLNRHTCSFNSYTPVQRGKSL